jgi:hypothetical protein
MYPASHRRVNNSKIQPYAAYTLSFPRHDISPTDRSDADIAARCMHHRRPCAVHKRAGANAHRMEANAQR